MRSGAGRAYDRGMRFPDITVALRGVRGPRRRYAAGLGVCALSFAMLASGACIGRGNGTSTGPSQNTGTVAAAARAADTPFAGVCSSGITPAVAATKRGNEEVTVVGPVVAAHYDANQTDAPTYLELGAPNPDPKSRRSSCSAATGATSPRRRRRCTKAKPSAWSALSRLTCNATQSSSDRPKRYPSSPYPAAPRPDQRTNADRR